LAAGEREEAFVGAAVFVSGCEHLDDAALGSVGMVVPVLERPVWDKVADRDEGEAKFGYARGALWHVLLGSAKRCR